MDYLFSLVVKQKDIRTFEFRLLGFPVDKVEMESEQALKILGIDKKQLNLDLLQQRAVTIYDLNEPEKEGSVYIQQKVINAYKTALFLLDQNGLSENDFKTVQERIHQGIKRPLTSEEREQQKKHDDYAFGGQDKD